MKKYIYILILTAAVGIIIGAPLKNHFIAEAQQLSWFRPMFWVQPSGWGQPYGWGGFGYEFQMPPLAWFPRAEITSRNPYNPVDPRIASDPRFTPPGFTPPGPGMSGGGLGYGGGSFEPVPWGTPPPPYERPVGVMIGDILEPPGFKFNYGAPPYRPPSYYPEMETGQSATVDLETNQWIIFDKDGKVIRTQPHDISLFWYY